MRGRHARTRRGHVVVLAAAAIALTTLILVSLTVAHSRNQESRSRLATTSPGIALERAETPPPESWSAAKLDWPGDVRWMTVVGLDLPVSAQAGPRDLTDGRARGFARSPAGAVFAALHLVVRTSPHCGPAVWTPTLRDQVVGPDSEAYATAVRDGYETARARTGRPYGGPLGRIYAAVIGVRIDAYSATAASLRLLVEAPGPDGEVARAATVVQVAWVGGDWRLIAPPLGDWATVRTPVTQEQAALYVPLPTRR